MRSIEIFTEVTHGNCQSSRRSSRYRPGLRGRAPRPPGRAEPLKANIPPGGWRRDPRRDACPLPMGVLEVEYQTGKTKPWTKVPYGRQGFKASHSNPKTWGTFEQVLDRYRRDGYDGIGYVFSKDDPYCGIDIDDCRDPGTGEVAPAKRAYTDRMASYTEVSPSGSGCTSSSKGCYPEAAGKTRLSESSSTTKAAFSASPATGSTALQQNPNPARANSIFFIVRFSTRRKARQRDVLSPIPALSPLPNRKHSTGSSPTPKSGSCSTGNTTGRRTRVSPRPTWRSVITWCPPLSATRS